MKKILLFISIVFFTDIIFAQTEFKATMGINLISVPSIQDYINQIYAPDDNQLNSFNTAAIFAFEVRIFFSGKI